MKTRMRPSLVLLAAVLTTSLAQAKPLYLTVPRTFGSDEAPTVEVAFEGRAPVEMRVMKPRDREAFLAAQANLRRAYTPTRKEENPAAALWRGINNVRSPGGTFLDALDPEFRRATSEAFPERTRSQALNADAPLARFREGPSTLIGSPSSMEVVHRQWLNLDLGGADQDYSVPGFNEWFGWRGGVQQRQVELPRLPVGLYVVQLVQGTVEGQVTLVVTDLTVQAKQTDDQVLVRVAGRDKRPRGEVQVVVRDGDRIIQRTTTNANGEVLMEDIRTPRLLITCQSGEDLAVVDTDYYSSLAITPDVYLYSDRPLYRPGDTASFRGIMREPGSALARLFFPDKRQVSVQLVVGTNAAGKAVKVPVDRYGAFSGELKIPKDAPPGVMRLRAVVDDAVHGSEARVQDYVKPTFFVELMPEREGITPGESIKAKIRARRYAGGVPLHTRYEVFLYRVQVDTPAWVDDAGLGGKGSAVTYTSSSTNEGALSVPQRLYSTAARRQEDGTLDSADPWASAELLDENGEAQIEVQVPALEAGEERIAWKYSLVVRARDSEGSMANASRTFFLAESEVQGQLSLNTKLVTWGAGPMDTPMLAVRSVTLSGGSYDGASGDVVFVLEEADGDVQEASRTSLTFGPDAVARVNLPRTGPGRLRAAVTLKDKRGKPWTGETDVLVTGAAGEPVARVVALTAESLSSTVDVDGDARLVALLPEGWGPDGKNEGKVWVTLSGARIHDSRVLDVRGNTLLHTFTTEERFGTAVHAQLAFPGRHGRWEAQTVPFRIIPTRKVLKVEVQPVVMEAQPMTEQTLRLRVTDHRGEGVPASVSISVVDKAVLALQPEFKPSILDFFYPLQRNSASDFYSADFQGYGYGEQLARMLLRGKGFDFAAIKPPTKLHSKDERDTAFWSGGVVTDGSGNATVTFRLPSNQTLWNVSAIAADASGRFGEGRAEFSARTGFAVASTLPQFLREGDVANISVRLSNTEKAPRPGVQLRIAAGGALEKLEKAETLEVGQEMEVLWPLQVKATSTGSGRLDVAVADKEVQRRDVRNIPVQPGVLSETVNVAGWAAAPLDLKAPQGATVTSATLSLMPSALGAALLTVRDLLTYPYGCLEQLVATTVPNLAVIRTLQLAGGMQKVDPASRALLEEADSRARQGIERILSLSLPTGGFTWFNGETQPSLPLTIIALDGLAYAVEAGVIPADEPRVTSGVKWLTAQNDAGSYYAPLRVYVLARLTGEKAAPLVRQLLDSSEQLDGYGSALAALAAEHAGVAKEEAVQQKLVSAVTRAREAMLADWRPTDSSWFWRFPLRSIGVSAVAAHATARAGQMDDARENEVRRRLLGALAARDTLSTLDRSTLLLHSQWLIERDIKRMKDAAPPTVLVGGTAREVKFRREGGALLGELGGGAPGTVTVQGFDGAASLTAQVTTPLRTLTPSESGMAIERSYHVLREGGRVALNPGDKVVRGDVVFVSLRFRLTDPPEARYRDWRSAYYVVEDQVPAGFVPVQEDKEYRGGPDPLPLSHNTVKQREFRPDRVTFFLEEPSPWGEQTREIGYVMRAQFVGSFTTGPATVQDMYAAWAKGRTGAATLEIAGAVTK
ncbi:MAG: MG2 domain-containing protein [Myxococcota bacterium]